MILWHILIQVKQEQHRISIAKRMDIHTLHQKVENVGVAIVIFMHRLTMTDIKLEFQ